MRRVRATFAQISISILLSLLPSCPLRKEICAIEDTIIASLTKATGTDSQLLVRFALLFPPRICDVWRLFKSADVKTAVSCRRKDATRARNIFPRCERAGAMRSPVDQLSINTYNSR